MGTTNDEEVRLWDQQPDEPDRAYSHFVKWLALDERNLVKAAKPLRLSYGRLRDLSSEHEWQARAAAFDQDEAKKLADATARDRLAAARAIAQDIRESAEARLTQDAAERDPAGVQRLATALKAIAPALEQPTTAPTVSIDIEGLYTAVRLREAQREEDEQGEAA